MEENNFNQNNIEVSSNTEELNAIMSESNNAKTKKGSVRTVVIVMVCVIVLGLLAFCVYNNYIKKNTKPVTPTNNKQQTVDDKKDDDKKNSDELAIPALKKDIVSKVNSILNADVKSNETIYNTYYYGFRDDFLKNFAISENDKRYIALNMVRETSATKINAPKEQIPFKEITDYYDDFITYDSVMEFFQLDANEVEEVYFDVFGEKMIHSNLQTCPAYFYDQDKKLYYGVVECGGTSAKRVVVYMDDVYTNADEAYTKLYVGIIDGESGNFELFSNLDETEKIKNLTEDEFDTYKITSDTKEQFSSFKFVFKKDAKNNYHFDRIEKIEK